MVPSPPEVGRWQGCKTGTFRRQVQRRCGSGERTPRSAANSRAALPGQPPQRQRRRPAITVRARTANTRRERAKTGAATQATGLRRLVLRFLFLEEVCRGPLPVLPERAAFCRWPRVLAGSVAAVEPHKPRRRAAPPQTVARGRRWRWHWRSGDRPSYLSGPRRKEPRSAAERLLALETKFLLFWAAQERDSVLSRSPSALEALHRSFRPAFLRHSREMTRACSRNLTLVARLRRG